MPDISDGSRSPHTHATLTHTAANASKLQLSWKDFALLSKTRKNLTRAVLAGAIIAAPAAALATPASAAPVTAAPVDHHWDHDGRHGGWDRGWDGDHWFHPDWFRHYLPTGSDWD